MTWIGLTGGIGSGKSTVAKALRLKGFAVIDADEMARRAVSPGSPGLNAVVQTFGQKILNPDGSLDRKALGAAVFSDASQLETLEKIIHPQVQELVRKERELLERQGHTLLFYDVPLLYEKALEKQFDAVLVVDCPEPERIRRVQLRDGLSETEIKKRLAHQLPLENKVKKAHYVVENQGDLKDLETQLDRIIEKMKRDLKI